VNGMGLALILNDLKSIRAMPGGAEAEAPRPYLPVVGHEGVKDFQEKHGKEM